MTSWVSLSGGLDSTFALWSLVEAGEAVNAHHVDLYRPMKRFGESAINRTRAEHVAVGSILEWFCQHGHVLPVTYSVLDWRNMYCALPEIEMLLPHVLNAFLVGGGVSTDKVVFGSNSGDFGAQPIPQREWGWGEMADALCGPETAPQIICYGQAFTRKEQIDLMPAELAGLTMSCRRPRLINGFWTPCGSRRQVGDGIREGSRSCTCVHLVDLLPRYAQGWAAHETEED